MRDVVQPRLDQLRYHRGYCASCNDITRMRVRRMFQRGWVNLREGFVCERCGLNGRIRMAWIALRATLPSLGDRPRMLMLERLSALYYRVAADLPTVEGSEYVGPDARPGELRAMHGMQIRHENMLELSPADGSLDLIFHGDVLEHVPDSAAALRECHRVLRPGGVMLFTVPFYALERNVVRARLDDGQLVHLHQPLYHANPIAPAGGSLVFTDHGWELLDSMADAGFTTVETGLLYDAYQGIVSDNNPTPNRHMWPVLFRATK